MVPTDSPPLIGRRRTHDGRPSTAATAGTGDAPSKTRRKAESQDLQDLGEQLVALGTSRFEAIVAGAALPERLVEAIVAARTITARGGRKRQMQFIGKLMRDVDPAPIARQLDAWAQGQAMDAAHQHALERWRDRLLAEPDALDALAAQYPGLDRPRFRSLIAKTTVERERGAPPRAYRELFRELKQLAAVAPDPHAERHAEPGPSAAP
jgi:ribosome-associated protein